MKTTLNLNDLRTAFDYKSNRELKHTWIMFYIIRKPFIVKLLKQLTEFGLKYHLPIKMLIKKTAFRVFCAGENEEEAFQTIDRLHRYHVKAVLDYVSEGEKSTEGYDSTTQKIINNIRAKKGDTSCDFISLKISGLEDPAYLTKWSQTQNERDKRYLSLYHRLWEICSAAAHHDIMVYIDAEKTWMQAIIDRLAEEMMRLYNKEKIIVFNTLQMYRTDRIAYLQDLITRTSEADYRLGIKLVRGAYHEKEILRAKQEGLDIPVFLTKEETDRAFNQAIDICLKNYQHVVMCIASHNEESVMYAISQLDGHLPKEYRNELQFSQLFGMSDNLTFNLAAGGFNTSKYLPYGEVEKAIPYLMRRAEENTAVNGQMNREFELLNKELKRRRGYYA